MRRTEPALRGFKRTGSEILAKEDRDRRKGDGQTHSEGIFLRGQAKKRGSKVYPILKGGWS